MYFGTSKYNWCFMNDFKQNKAGYYYSDQCNLAEFQEIINQKLTEDMVPNAFEVNDNIPIYDISELHDIFRDFELKSELMAEWAWVLKKGSGVIVLRNAYRDTSAIDEATRLYEGIIADEKL